MNQIEKIIDIATWNRKEHFEHFSAFDDPFFGVTVNVDCTRAYREAKNKGVSFSLLLLVPWVKADDIVVAFHIFPFLIFLIASYHHGCRQSRRVPLSYRRRKSCML